MNLTLDLTRLQVTMNGENEIIVRRDFTHPPARVWRGLTEPSLIRQWMSIKDYPMTRCEIDARPGGSFHYEWLGPNGNAFFFSGPILTVDAPHCMTHVEFFNGDETTGVAVTTDLVARGTGTRMTMLMRYDSAEARAAAIATGMTDGMEETYAKLEALLPML